MAGWHHRFDGHEFGWTPRVGNGQGGLACCNSWGCKESDTTERLNWTELKDVKMNKASNRKANPKIDIWMQKRKWNVSNTFHIEYRDTKKIHQNKFSWKYWGQHRKELKQYMNIMKKGKQDKEMHLHNRPQGMWGKLKDCIVLLNHKFRDIWMIWTGSYAEARSRGKNSCYIDFYGTPLQHSCLENPMDGGAWWATVHGVAKSWTRLSDITFTFHFHALEKDMATHSSVLAWRISGMEEPGGLPSMGSHRVGQDWSNLAAAAA